MFEFEPPFLTGTCSSRQPIDYLHSRHEIARKMPSQRWPPIVFRRNTVVFKKHHKLFKAKLSHAFFVGNSLLSFSAARRGAEWKYERLLNRYTEVTRKFGVNALAHDHRPPPPTARSARGEPDGGGCVSGDGLQTRPRALGHLLALPQRDNRLGSPDFDSSPAILGYLCDYYFITKIAKIVKHRHEIYGLRSNNGTLKVVEMGWNDGSWHKAGVGAPRPGAKFRGAFRPMRRIILSPQWCFHPAG